MRPLGAHGLALATKDVAHTLSEEEARPIVEGGEIELHANDIPALHEKPGVEEEDDDGGNAGSQLFSSSLFSIHSINSFLSLGSYLL